nr:unnamed protein product [Spirometra erinaceieuropaei]
MRCRRRPLSRGHLAQSDECGNGHDNRQAPPHEAITGQICEVGELTTFEIIGFEPGRKEKEDQSKGEPGEVNAKEDEDAVTVDEVAVAVITTKDDVDVAAAIITPTLRPAIH